MNISLPDFSLVVLIGVSGSGKSTFARQHFLASEVISSDACRALVADNENDQTATNEAFEVLHFITAKRLHLKRLTVIDATNVQAEARKPLIALARQYHCLPVAIVLDMPETLCRERNAQRPDRTFGGHVIAHQRRDLRQALRGLAREGFRQVMVLRSPEEVAQVSISRQPLYNDLRHLSGPFDIIGDVHGCYTELVTLLETLGYQVSEQGVIPPEGRTAVFLGDLVDRGPAIPQVLRLVMGMVAAGQALCVPGNHDLKLVKALRGKKVQLTHGLDKSLAQLEAESAAFKQEVAAFLDDLVSHYVLDGGKLVVAHAGMKAEMQGRASGAVREFALYGETTGETDEFGLPIRHNWAAEYRGSAMVVYGHTPVPTPDWLNQTINIDTGCVFGGELTALRYPERELVSVAALYTYAEPARPFLAESAPALNAQQQADDMLDIAEVLGKRIISTRLKPSVIIREANAAAALEVMSRFAIDPHWLIYLPPTMSPPETSTLPDLLEHPAEAFAYFRHEGVPQVICQEKHMGSRAVVILCRDAEAARHHFGVMDGTMGVCYTRTGRAFFTDPNMENAFLDRLQHAITTANLWAELATAWLALDCELMPWSAKAQELLRRQYAAVGSAAHHAFTAANQLLSTTATPDIQALAATFQARAAHIKAYIAAYRRYCWSVTDVADLKLAPFHILASEGAVHSNKTHLWHMETIARLCQADPGLLLPTQYCLADLTDPASEAQAITWWENLTAQGGEGMVVKPLDFVVKGRRGLLQPAIKCRGREYLRIIYGPEYTAHLDSLRARGVGGKRKLAVQEFALGMEALDRFVRREPLRRVHECTFGILALESEPLDPRL